MNYVTIVNTQISQYNTFVLILEPVTMDVWMDGEETNVMVSGNTFNCYIRLMIFNVDGLEE